LAFFGKQPDTPAAPPSPNPHPPTPERIPAASPPPPVPGLTPSTSSTSSTVIGSKVKLVGDLSGDEDILINGRVEGKIRVDRKKIDTDSIRRIGRYAIPIQIFEDVTVEVKTLVVPEGGELPPEEELAAMEAAEAEVQAAAQAEATHRCLDVLQLTREALRQRDRDLLVGHVRIFPGDQPRISSTDLPRLAAMSSGDLAAASAFTVARTTLIGLREP